MRYHNILLVEDDPIDIMVVQRAIEIAGVGNPLYIAKDGIEALEYLRGQNGKDRIGRPVIILLDLMMPRMNGLDFLVSLRKDEELCTVPVIVFSSSADKRDIDSAYDNCISGYMTKAVGMDQMIEKIQAIEKYWSLCEMES